MIRIRELIADVRSRYPKDDFFGNFEYSCRISAAKRASYRAYNRALVSLDDESWNILKRKALRHYFDYRKGQKKQGFFNQLNEAFAYHYLVIKGFRDVRFIEEAKETRPDIAYTIQGKQNYCEVKTLGISNDEIERRCTIAAHSGSIYASLSDGFLHKFDDSFQIARRQIGAVGSNGLVYIIMRIDDIALDYYQDYRKQLISFATTHGFDNLFIKIGLLGNKRICMD